MRDFDEVRYNYLQKLDSEQAEQFRNEYEEAVTADFLARTPNFIGSPENARALVEQVKSLEATGMVLGPRLMDQAHSFLVEREHKQLLQQANRLSNRELEERLRAAGEPIYRSTI